MNTAWTRVGNPYDNAKAESFMKTLKQEEIDGRHYRDIDDALCKIGALRQRGPLLLMAQRLDVYRARRITFVHALVRAVELGIWVHTVDGCRRVQLVKPKRSDNRGSFQSVQRC